MTASGWGSGETARARIVAMLLTGLAACSSEPKVANWDSAGSTIICFGNSLTEGTGASPGHDVPSLLARALGREVVNAGAAGETTEQGLRRLSKDVLKQDPLLVIVEFGANDFLQQVPLERTFANLEEMVRRIQEKGAMVALVEVPSAFVGNPAGHRFRALAARRRTAFVPNILEGISSEPKFRSDTFHPNDAGYEMIAERILRVARPLLKARARPDGRSTDAG